MTFKDYYQILGIPKDAGAKDIKKAYRKLATQFHPDKTSGDKAKEERFKEISEAYQVLGDAERRKQYDDLGSDWVLFQQSGNSYEDFTRMRNQYQHAGKSASYQYDSTPFGDHSGFSDFFETFFGSGGSRPRNRQYGYPGADVSGQVSIGLHEAYYGTERIIDYDGAKIKLKIKPGAFTGLQLRAKGKGQKGHQGKAGDLYIKVIVSPHTLFTRKGNDLHQQVTIDVFDALLGATVEVATMSGKVQMRLKEGTQNGKIVRLKGKGMPVYGKPGEFGDLYIRLNVAIPKKLSQEQRKGIEAIKKSFKSDT